MPVVLDTLSLPNGHHLVIASSESNSSICRGQYGRWGQPYRLALVETDGSPYQHARCRGVLRTISVIYADGRYQGPRSGYAAKVERLREEMNTECQRLAGRR